MKNTIKILCLILLATFNLSSWAGENKTEENNTCEALRKHLSNTDISSLYKELNLSESKTYNEKQLSYQEEKRDSIRTGIENAMPTIKMSNGNSWENGTITRNNQFLISGESKLFMGTGRVLTGYIGDGERKQLKRVSVLEEVESQLAKFLEGNKVEKTTAYLFLRRIIKPESNLYEKLSPCFDESFKVEEPPKNKYEIEIKPIKIEVIEKEEVN
jgi:hypothetical protein